MKKIQYLYSDFETLYVELPSKYKNYKEYFETEENPKLPQVYSWNILYDKEYDSLSKDHYVLNEEDGYACNYNINGNNFIKFIEGIKVDAIMYFNNLKGFDGHFFVPLLDEAGYTPVYPMDMMENKEVDENVKLKTFKRIVAIRESILKNAVYSKKYETLKKLNIDLANDYLKKLIEKRWSKMQPYEYTMITNEGKQIYEIKVGLPNTKRTKGVRRNRALIIRDNLLMFPTSIAEMGKTIAKAEVKAGNCTEEEAAAKYHKLEIDGGYNRTELYNSVEELEQDGNELEYLIRDTFVLWKFHKLVEKHFPRRQWQLTIASTSYKDWKDNLGKKLVDNMIASGEVEEVQLKNGVTRLVYKNKRYITTKLYNVVLNQILPTKWLDTPLKDSTTQVIWDDMYRWYGGGLTFVNETYRGKFLENISVADINSSYPSVMVGDDEVPYGKAHYGDHKDYKFKFYKITIIKKIVNKKGLPFLYDEYYEKREYLKTLKPMQEFRLTSIEYERFLRYYTNDESKFKKEVIYCFKTLPIKKLFKDFIDKWYTIKEQASMNKDIILKMIAKLFLNSSYGKHGTKRERASQIWDADNTEWIKLKANMESKYYLPIACAITALARMKLVDAVDENYHNFVYCDTDSIFVRNFKPSDYKNVELHPTKLGAWDIEYADGYGIVRRPKQYLFLNNTEKYKLAFAGINFNKWILPQEELDLLKPFEAEIKKLDLKHFILGKKINKQLSPYRLVGTGITFMEIEKTIKPIWDYKEDTILTEQKYYLKEHFIQTLKDLEEFKNKTHKMTRIQIFKNKSNKAEKSSYNN